MFLCHGGINFHFPNTSKKRNLIRMSMSKIIFGRNPVIEALKSEAQIDKIFIDEKNNHTRLFEIEQLARQKGVIVQKAAKDKLVNIAGGDKTQGVVAYLLEQEFLSVEDILQLSQSLNEPPLLAMLDGIEDPHNLGAILRSADGAGLHGVVLPKRRTSAITPVVAKSSAGALAHVNISRVANLNNAIDVMKKQGVWFVGTDQDAEQIYTEADLTGPMCVIIGREGKGMHRLVKEKCDYLVKIPMHGKVTSLNASVAAALLFFEIRRQRGG